MPKWVPADRTVASMGVTVHIGIDYIRNMVGAGKKTLEEIGGYNVLTVYWNRISFLSAALKRGLDLVGGLAGCLITAVLTVFIGPAIYIASPSSSCQPKRAARVWSTSSSAGMAVSQKFTFFSLTFQLIILISPFPVSPGYAGGS